MKDSIVLTDVEHAAQSDSVCEVDHQQCSFTRKIIRSVKRVSRTHYLSLTLLKIES